MFLQRVLFRDETTCHINGCVNRYNCRVQGKEQTNVIQEYVCDSAKLRVCCVLFHDKVIGLFFFEEKTITGFVYSDILELFKFPQLDDIEQHISRRAHSSMHFQSFHPHIFLKVATKDDSKRRFQDQLISWRDNLIC